jgi:hypothetical protein
VLITDQCILSRGSSRRSLTMSLIMRIIVVTELYLRRSYPRISLNMCCTCSRSLVLWERMYSATSWGNVPRSTMFDLRLPNVLITPPAELLHIFGEMHRRCELIRLICRFERAVSFSPQLHGNNLRDDRVTFHPRLMGNWTVLKRLCDGTSVILRGDFCMIYQAASSVYGSQLPGWLIPCRWVNVDFHAADTVHCF